MPYRTATHPRKADGSPSFSNRANRISWPLGKVEEVLPGADGQVRVARVKTSSGVFLRPVQRLFPLEIKQI
ncbi:hypothetical protein LAZ67_2004109 [Cordylochernes scorpioides]|uniref:DUF5641 domain-containing protein n=1 Tax=Cordylochernes scorpioides TaxID=51811 RepID=A0ABY6K6G4_9ARAC|nr:hypothetical protein LAZ67_2004109 [Cordylochernes scorpioides]